MPESPPDPLPVVLRFLTFTLGVYLIIMIAGFISVASYDGEVFYFKISGWRLVVDALLQAVLLTFFTLLYLVPTLFVRPIIGAFLRWTIFLVFTIGMVSISIDQVIAAGTPKADSLVLLKPTGHLHLPKQEIASITIHLSPTRRSVHLRTQSDSRHRIGPLATDGRPADQALTDWLTHLHTWAPDIPFKTDEHKSQGHDQ